MRSGVAFCPSIDFLERAWQDACRGVPSEAPYLEVECPSSIDPTLTDDGSVIVTMFTQYGPYEESGWPRARARRTRPLPRHPRLARAERARRGGALRGARAARPRAHLRPGRRLDLPGRAGARPDGVHAADAGAGAVRDAGRRPVPVRGGHASRRRRDGARRPQRGAARAARRALAPRAPAGAGGAAGRCPRPRSCAPVRRGRAHAPRGEGRAGTGRLPPRTSTASSRRRSRPASPAGCTRASTAARAGRSSSGCWSRSSSAAPPTRCPGTCRAPTTCWPRGQTPDRALPEARSARRVARRLRGHRGERGVRPSGIETTAVRRDGGWVINGEKWFVTYGDVAAVYIVVAMTDEGPTLFLVDRGCDGISVVDDPPFTHSYPHGHPTIRFTDVVVGDDAVIGGSAKATRCSARGSPRSGSGSRRAASGRCGGCSRRRRRGRCRASRAVADHGLPGRVVPAGGLGGRRRGGPRADAGGRAADGRGRRPEGHPRQGVDGQAVRARPRTGAPTARCRCSAGAATCAPTSPSGSCANCASTASGRARARSSG